MRTSLRRTSLSLANSTLPTLFSQGVAVTYSRDRRDEHDTLTATAGGRTVFTLVVNADGSWTFDLDDQLDHVDNGPNDENFAAAHFAERLGWCSVDRLLVDRCGDRPGRRRDHAERGQLHDCGSGRHSGSERRAGCGDGAGGWPQRGGGSEPPAGLNGNDLSTGNKEGGETDAADETSGLAGSLSGLVTVGADEPATTSLSLANSTLPTLFSQGVAVTYSLNGTTDTLTATAGGRTVFTLVVNADGSWTFDLDDQLDHVDNGLNDENFAAAHFAERRGWCSVDRLLVDRCGDRPGRRRDHAERGQLHDRGSGRHSGSERRAGCGVGAGGWPQRGGGRAAWGLNGNDLSTGNKEGGETDAADETSGLAGSLSGLVTVGADEPPTHQPVAGQQHAADAVLAGRSGHLLAQRHAPTR